MVSTMFIRATVLEFTVTIKHSVDKRTQAPPLSPFSVSLDLDLKGNRNKTESVCLFPVWNKEKNNFSLCFVLFIIRTAQNQESVNYKIINWWNSTVTLFRSEIHVTLQWVKLISTKFEILCNLFKISENYSKIEKNPVETKNMGTKLLLIINI